MGFREGFRRGYQNPTGLGSVIGRWLAAAVIVAPVVIAAILVLA